MEDSAEVNIIQQKVKNASLDSAVVCDSPVKKLHNELEKVIPNGTGNNTAENMSEDTTIKGKTKTIKITKVSKVSKTEPVKEKSETPETPSKIPPLNSSPSSSPDFHGFGDLTESSEELTKKEAFHKLLSRLEDVEEQRVESERETVGEAMTADDVDMPDTDSNQMEIDEGNSQADSADFSDKTNKGKARDSDVDVMETDSVKSGGDISKSTEDDEGNKAVPDMAVTESASQHKVEYCGGCSKAVDDAEEGICCDGKCERWFHLQCSGLTQIEYDELSLDENAKWACNTCSGKPPPEIKPGTKPLLTVRKDLTVAETPTPKRKMPSKEEKRPRVDISNPIFLKPFDYGWKRELVFRSTTDSQNKKHGDVYYYTPKGKKLRSLREISEHLIGTDLTVDNFTFWKDALGCDPDKEIIRDAKIKLTNRDSNVSPLVTKKLTPKTPKTPKSTPKLTATVPPLDTTSVLPVTPKASASVTPRVVLKGKPSISSGPKFKVTPSKATVPGQAQKITITKGSDITTTKEVRYSNSVDYLRSKKSSIYEHLRKNKTQVSEDNLKDCANEVENESEVIEIIPKNKFRRYGLLANRISTRNIARKRRSKSSSSSSSTSSEELTSYDRQTKTSIVSNLENINASGLKLTEKNRSQMKKKSTESSFVPSLSDSVFNNTSKLTSTPNTVLLPNQNLKRPRSPEIQFRPSDPSSYGCKTNAVPPGRPAGPNMSGISSSLYRPPFETVLIVDTSPQSETLNSSPKRRSAPYNPPSPVPWTHDCSIEVFSVETLPSKDGFLNENYLLTSPSRQTALVPKKQSSLVRANASDRFGNLSPAKNRNNFSPISIGSSSGEIVVLDDEPGDNSSPPFLMRNSPPPNLVRNPMSPVRSPPSLQPILPPPPLLPCPSRTIPEHILTSSGENSSVISIDSAENSTVSLVSSEETQDSNVTGSKFEEYRQFKRERFYERQKAKRELEKLKRSYQRERKLFIKRKAEEKKLQIEYLRLKVKIKGLKLSHMQKKT